MRIDRFESVPSYAAIVKRDAAGEREARAGYGHDEWAKGLTFETACTRAVEGDRDLVGVTSDAIAKVVASAVAEAPRNRYVPHFAGSRVSVPDYLGGSPRCMRARQVKETPSRHVGVYVSTTCSAGISASDMLKRGSTILGFLEYLQASQIAVDLYLIAETHGRTDGDYIQVIRVESRPLDLSTAAFAIAHPAFARLMTYSYASFADGFDGGWPRTYHQKDYQERRNAAIGVKPGDVVIKSAESWDDSIKNPEKWLADRITQLKEAA